MIAKLVYITMLTRVIVNENATPEQIAEAAAPAFIQRIEEEGLDEHIEKVVDDTEMPYGTSIHDR